MRVILTLLVEELAHAGVTLAMKWLEKRRQPWR